MKTTIITASIIGILGVFLVSSTYAAGGYRRSNTTYTPGTNTSSATFVDANNDGVCDNYVNRPQDGTGKKYGRNR
nr:hypothetical protein [Candidatus Gracilibacteria bacterium]